MSPALYPTPPNTSMMSSVDSSTVVAIDPCMDNYFERPLVWIDDRRSTTAPVEDCSECRTIYIAGSTCHCKSSYDESRQGLCTKHSFWVSLVTQMVNNDDIQKPSNRLNQICQRPVQGFERYRRYIPKTRTVVWTLVEPLDPPWINPLVHFSSPSFPPWPDPCKVHSAGAKVVAPAVRWFSSS